MRRAAILALPAMLLLALPVQAQHWNDVGPGRDLLGSTIAEFDYFRQRLPAAPAVAIEPMDSVTPILAPAPMLDYAQPTPQPVVSAPIRRRAAPRRRIVRRPVQNAVQRDSGYDRPATSAATGGADWERRLAQREQELDRLRRQMEDDRLRYEQSRQPTLR